MPKYKVGVFGSAGGEEEIAKALPKAAIIGAELGKRNCVVITGACRGLPYAAAVAAHEAGAEVWGFSPMLNLEQQIADTAPDDNTIYAKLVYIPEDFEFKDDDLVCRKYRNVMSTATCDAGIIIAGRWGTMHEFCSLYDFGKVIGVLTGTSGIADELPELAKIISKESKAKIIFNSNPAELVQLVFSSLQEMERGRREVERT